MNFFSKEKDPITDKRLILIKVIEKIEKSNIGDFDILEDIKLELQEGIPLSKEKKKYLQNSINHLKQIKNP